LKKIFYLLFIISCSYPLKYDNDFLNDPRDVKDVISFYEQQIKYSNIKINKRRTKLLKAITLRNKIILPKQWDKLSNHSKMLFIVHEFEHLKQWRKHKVFGLKYIFDASFRLQVEIDATKPVIQALYSIGVEYKNIEGFIILLSYTIYKQYSLQLLGEDYVVKKIQKDLLNELNNISSIDRK